MKGTYGRRTLLKAQSTPVMEAALRLRMNELARVGISRDFGNRVECWVDPAQDQSGFRAVVEEADAVAREAVAAERLHAEQVNAWSRERAAALLAEVDRLARERVATMLADLRGLLAETPWLLQGRVAIEAAELAAREDLDGDQWRRARRLVENARATRARGEETLGQPVDDAERCGNADLRKAVLEGCRYLSAEDADHATEANDAGWSRSSTVLGHLLAAMPELAPTQAAHGLRLLTRHRKQLPRDLRIRLGV